MSSSSRINTPNDKFTVDETAPFFAIEPTGSYGSFTSGIKNEYVLKFKDLETKNVIKKSGILDSTSKTVPNALTKTILTFSENPELTFFFDWSEVFWRPDFELSVLPKISYVAYVTEIEATQLKGPFPTIVFSSNLINVQVGNSVTSIGKGTFKDCINLTSIQIPNSVTTFGNEAFKNCYKLTSIKIPYTVGILGIEAFKDCVALASATFSKSQTQSYMVLDTFRNCISLTSIEIPQSLYVIGNGSFANSGLRTVILPDPNSLNLISPQSNVSFYGATGVNIILPT
jgi:hypothetical protein